MSKIGKIHRRVKVMLTAKVHSLMVRCTLKSNAAMEAFQEVWYKMKSRKTIVQGIWTQMMMMTKMILS